MRARGRTASSSRESLPLYSLVPQDPPPAYVQHPPNESARFKNGHRRFASSRSPGDPFTDNSPGSGSPFPEGSVMDSAYRVASARVRHQIYLQAVERCCQAQFGSIMPSEEVNGEIPAQDPELPESRYSLVDTFAYLVALFTLVFWPFNIMFEFTGRLCENLAAKVLFCGLPSIGVLGVWISTMQKNGLWLTRRGGRTARAYKIHRAVQQLLFIFFTIAPAVLLTCLMFWICHNGCGEDILSDERWCVISSEEDMTMA